MKIFKNLINICLIVLSIISILITGVYAYYHFLVKDETVGVNYISTQTPVDLYEKADDLSDIEIAEFENRVLFNVNIYSNSNKTGIDLQEIMINYFTDYSLETSTCRSTGIQLLFDVTKMYEYSHMDTQGAKELTAYFKSCDTNIYYYEMHDNISYQGSSLYDELDRPLTRDSKFIIKIDDKPYLIQLDGTYSYEKDKKFLGFLWKTGTETITEKYDYTDLLLEFITNVKSNSLGYGDYYLKVDISKFFTSIKAYDEESGKFTAQPDVDITKNYTYLKFHYDENGAVSSSQSMFNKIACQTIADNDEETDSVVDYSQAKIEYNLTTEDLSYRYSELYNGYLVSLNQDMKTILTSAKKSVVNIYIDFDSDYVTKNKYNIVGIDMNGFENVKLNILQVVGNGDFYLLDKSLNGTELNQLQKSSTINLNVSDTAIDTAYEVVII